MDINIDVRLNGRLGIVHSGLSDEDFGHFQKLIQTYGDYSLLTEGKTIKAGVGIGEGILVGTQEAMKPFGSGRTIHHQRVCNSYGTEMIFPPRSDVAIKVDELIESHGSIYGRQTLTQRDGAIFRGLYTVLDRNGRMNKAEGDASEALTLHVQEAMGKWFAAAAQKLFGTPLVVPKMFFGNLLLPGQEVAMHHDVPEFRGMHPKTAPSWLQVAMHGSGLFGRWRILQAAALTYYQRMGRGNLAVYAPDGEGIVIPAKPKLGVILEAETCAHHSDIFAPELGQKQWTDAPVGSKLRYLDREECWLLSTSNGVELQRFRPDEVRVSTQMKLHCFRNEEEQRMYLEHTDDLSIEQALDMMTDDLRRRGWFKDPAPSRADLAVMMVKEYVRWPAPEAVARCWAQELDSVFARAALGSPKTSLKSSAWSGLSKL